MKFYVLNDRQKSNSKIYKAQRAVNDFTISILLVQKLQFIKCKEKKLCMKLSDSQNQYGRSKIVEKFHTDFKYEMPQRNNCLEEEIVKSQSYKVKEKMRTSVK